MPLAGVRVLDLSGDPGRVRVAVRIAAYDGAYVDIKDPDGFSRDARAAHQLGFAGKSCIHPTQIALANEVFRPSQPDRALAA